ncbi:aspartate ammonia-lyase [Geobacter sp. SVR]|uniref:aspartate ammonia-lyase n=1 Tax=Geobacter sp. SVR TaxID=2495594 RepID=UPI00143EF675|nr:aspartate ammonia-lyase [Geobacter sp. SVR]BCS56052.1 aspartate ammonia-lyase [Geobacter sp. SVR]GCF84815.1 aspartate ammonia-lyase [Geobacter sp. SVR]
MSTRIEKDTLGEMAVPAQAYYGAQTARAVRNFPISGLKPHPSFVWATVIIKKCAAMANMATGRLPAELGGAIVAAADEVLAGRLNDQFVVDPFQAGAGTSHNMNVNEVLANRALELLGRQRGDFSALHPNDHVNMAQSTNDVIPTAIRLAALELLDPLLEVLEELEQALADKGREFDGILKSGRTHLQDAVPIRLGQEFGAYGMAIRKNREGLEACIPALLELGIGGTAVGTGLNAEPAFIGKIVEELALATGFPLVASADLFEAMQNMDPFLALSSALRRTAVTLGRIANDLRLLSSGPRTGLDEIRLPAVQPGSSIMPGKINPSMAEMANMVCFQVIGCDQAVMQAAQAGQLELNVMMPLIAYNLTFSLEILRNCVQKFTQSCIIGIVANQERCRRYLEDSLGLVTVLAPYIGYNAAAEVAKESIASGRSIREIVLSRGLMPEADLEEAMRPEYLTEPGLPLEK